jgi:hypothetical protein
VTILLAVKSICKGMLRQSDNQLPTLSSLKLKTNNR